MTRVHHKAPRQQGIEQRVRIAATLYEARDVLRRLWGDAYRAKMAELISTLKAIHEAKGGDSFLSTCIDEAVAASNLGYHWASVEFLAAAVEDISPTRLSHCEQGQALLSLDERARLYRACADAMGGKR